MSDFKTKADVLRALADGKKIVCYGARFKLDAVQGLMVKDHREWHQAHLSLRGPADCYALYVDPNPHPAGSYLWAREEHARGQRVKRNSLLITQGDVWDEMSCFDHADFIATDWRVV